MIFSSKIHCQGCIDKIISSLTFLEGIKKVQIDIENQTITVESNDNYAEKVIKALSKINIVATRIN